MLRAASSALRRRAARAPRASCAAPGAAPQPSSPAPPPAAAAAASFFSTTGASGRDLFNPTEEHQALRDMVRSFAQDEVDPQRLEHDREEKFNHALFRKCGELGLLGVTTDVEYGGSGMDATAACIVHEELSQADPSFCLSYLAHSMLFVNNLNQNGNAEQKARLLPDVCSGAKIGGMGMSEPNNGTDVLGLTTTAVKDDADGSYVLNGTKMWITNSYVTNDSLGSGETGDVYLIYARTGGAGAKGLSLFLVEKGMEGFSPPRARGGVDGRMDVSPPPPAPPARPPPQCDPRRAPVNLHHRRARRRQPPPAAGSCARARGWWWWWRGGLCDFYIFLLMVVAGKFCVGRTKGAGGEGKGVDGWLSAMQYGTALQHSPGIGWLSALQYGTPLQHTPAV